MPDKSIAIRIGTEALYAAYEKAGGKFPMPGETDSLSTRGIYC
jgi:hypothetical protein